METTLSDCAWCDRPMHVVRAYVMREPRTVDLDGDTLREGREVVCVTAVCVFGHYYGGPLADVEADPDAGMRGDSGGLL